jgi:hypothetical protein
MSRSLEGDRSVDAYALEGLEDGMKVDATLVEPVRIR